MWGNNSQGELGLGDSNNRSIPEQPHFSRPVVLVRCGMAHTAAVTGSELCVNGVVWLSL